MPKRAARHWDQGTLADVGKPPYRVPSMAEIKTTPANGLTVVSTFSGCGGSCLGFRWAGYRVLWASEFIPEAARTYRANWPDATLDEHDVRRVQPEDILARIGAKPGDVDVLEGSPPCASFSISGKREAGWGRERKYSDGKQRVDDLFFEFIRILRGVRPRVFVAENVPGILQGAARLYLDSIVATMRDAGYDVAWRRLDAQWHGVPQNRVRVFFVGVRADLGRRPAFPDPLPWRYTVRDACPWIARAEEDTGGAWGAGEITDRPAPTVRAAGVGHIVVDAPPVEPEAWLKEGHAITGEWGKLREGDTSDRYFSLGKLRVDAPAQTILANHGHSGTAGIVYPFERRKLSIGELRRLCGFPDDFVLTGVYRQQWERLGRAVPPPLARRVAEALIPILNAKGRHRNDSFRTAR